jgi:MFS family permease
MSSPQSAPVRSENTIRPRRRNSFAALRHRDFRLLWAGQFVSITGSQMQFLAINWHVYLLTKSAFALGLVGLVRVVPIILCSLLGGVVADAVDRRRLIVAAQTLMLASAGVLAAVTASGLKSVWPIYVLTAISSAAVAFDNPARQSLLPTLVPAKDFPNAVSLGLVAFQVATVLGPALAGLLLGFYSPAIIYAANAASFLAVIVAVLLIRAGRRSEKENAEASKISFEALGEGLRFVWCTPIIVQTMTLDFIATFFASATALLPIFADRILHVGARGLGILAASPAAGAVVAGLIMARLGSAAMRKPGAVIIGSIAVYGAATIAFGFSNLFWLSLSMLALTGAADTVSTVLRQTIRQLVTPDNLRGRMTSVNMMFFMGGPQLGELEAGAVASVFGAQLSVITGGVGCLLAVALATFGAKHLLNYKSAAIDMAKR